MLFSILLVIHALLAILIVVVVLIQPGAEGGTVFTGGMSSQTFGADTAGVLTKTTAILGALFLINSLFLSVVGTKYFNKSSVVIQQVEKGKKK